MKDRASKYPGRVTLTPVPGQANTYDLVRADEPTQEGMSLNKENLLNDNTCSILGIPTTSSVSYAIMTSYLQASGKAAVEIHCKLPNGKPAAYAKVSGLTGTADTIANDQGVLTTLVDIGSATIKIDGFLDLNSTAKSVNLQAGLTVITLETTLKAQPKLTITSSLADVAFSGMVDTFDIFCVGGGGAGGGSFGGADTNVASVQGGGGGGGYTTTSLNQIANPQSRTNAVVGAGGAAHSNNQSSVSTPGGAGGKTSIFNLEVLGGQGGSSSTNDVPFGKGGNGGSSGAGGGASGWYNTYPGGAGGQGGTDGGAGAVGGSALWPNNMWDSSAGTYWESGAPGGVGQGSTTRAFGEPNGLKVAAGGGSGGGYPGTNGTNGDSGAYGAHDSTYGRGGRGCHASSFASGGTGPTGGESGAIMLRWRWKA